MQNNYPFPRMLPATVENIEEAWLPAAEAELTALAAEAEKVERMPDTLLLRPPPPGGVDLITPDPRYSMCADTELLTDQCWRSLYLQIDAGFCL